MRTAQGQWVDGRTAPPVTQTDIRRWAMATFYPEKPPRLYWDAKYAATTRWGGIVAPPDFNPSPGRSNVRRQRRRASPAPAPTASR